MYIYNIYIYIYTYIYIYIYIQKIMKMYGNIQKKLKYMEIQKIWKYMELYRKLCKYIEKCRSTLPNNGKQYKGFKSTKIN